MKFQIVLYSIAVLVTCLEVSSIADHDSGDPQDFSSYKIKFRRNYTNPQDEDKAAAAFAQALNVVKAHNKRFQQGLETYQLELNSRADIPLADLRKRNGRKPNTGGQLHPTGRVKRALLPANFSWVALKKVTPVRDQMQCGSCYAHSVMGAIESQYLIQKNLTYNLSRQQAVDCSTSFGYSGCNGGLESYTFKYLIKASGNEEYPKYPYTGTYSSCSAVPADFKAQIIGFNDTYSVTVATLKSFVYNIGPICVGMDASLSSFQLYKSGIYDNAYCRSEPYNMNHSVLLVGWGIDNGKQYWLVKNSWGTGWGIGGYFKIATANNRCGILNDVLFPIIA